MWGDSHAGRLYVGIAHDYGGDFNIGQLIRDSCPPILNFGDEVCVESNAYAVSLMEKHPADLVVMFAVWNRYEPDLRTSKSAILLQVTVERLKAIGTKHILVVGPAPQWSDDLPSLLAKFWRAHMLISEVPAVMKHGLEEGPFDVDRQLKALISEGPATYVSVIDLLCGPDGCRTRTTEGRRA